ncbi:MAG: hypothetical protein RL095_901 [Verrucomicrobiota bacterium]|jgi:putative hemolysin
MNTAAELPPNLRFSIDELSPLFGRGLLRPARPLLDRLLGLEGLNRLYCNGLAGLDPEAFIDTVMQRLGIEIDIDPACLARIPATGPVVAIANHPLGALDGMILSRILSRARPDAKVMANSFLKAIPEIREKLILVDSFQRGAANTQGLRRSVEWLKAGHCLGMFPAGAVSRFDLREACITDAEWSQDAFRLARMSGATVVPVWFSARNSRTFYTLGALHPLLRTILLPREMARPGQKIRVALGKPIEARTLNRFEAPQAGTDYLRLRCSVLAENGGRQQPCVRPERQTRPLLRPVDRELLAAEIAALPEASLLVSQGEWQIRIFRSGQGAGLMLELGRLREEAFRAAGEGTGAALDLDFFDERYLQMILWNDVTKQIAGGYRIGLVDELVRDQELSALYTRRFFDYGPEFLTRHPAAAELGRSFIALEFQRRPQCLPLLWRGICRFAKKSGLRHLFGPVSISAEYDTLSRSLMVELLQERKALIKAKDPHRGRLSRELRQRCARFKVTTPEDLSDLIRAIEHDGKDLPVLVKHYMKMGARFYGFGVDDKFGGTLDGLIVVDLAVAPLRTLEAYMGDGTAAYQDSLKASGPPCG